MTVTLLLSGVPGAMCREIAALASSEAYRQDFTIAEAGLSSREDAGRRVELAPAVSVVCEPAERAGAVLSRGGLESPVVVDFSAPDAVAGNLAVYTKVGVPLVVGTTGYDRQRAAEMVRSSRSCAVLAPNMAAPVVAITAALRWASERFPGVLQGHELHIVESHQSSKRDISGTARALLPAFQALGLSAQEDVIEPVRDSARQRDLGVSGEHLGGHAWHWYRARSPEGAMELELSHRINGRRVYAEGALLAARFVAAMAARGAEGTVYSMEDVLANPAAAPE